MKPPRGLTSEEAAAWAKLAATVVPLGRASRTTATDDFKNPPQARLGRGTTRSVVEGSSPPTKKVTHPPSFGRSPSPSRDGEDGLDSHWDRRFRAGAIEPDFTLDLHGLTLNQAHARLDDGLAQALAMRARVVLLIAGKPRPAEAADRGIRRGAIRAKILDWLASGPHGASVAAVRKAHRRHGGEGALYLVLKRRR